MFKKKCLKCDSTDLRIKKPGAFTQIWWGLFLLAVFPIALLIRPKTYYFCKSCNFDWKD